VLEVGVFRGETTAALAGVAERVVGVDVAITSAAVNRTQEFPNVTLHEGEAVAVLHTLAGPFDVVFIDAGHRYADVKEQTDAVWSKVRAGGLLVYHDVFGAEDEGGVKRFLDERFPQAVLLPTTPFPWAGVTGLGIVQKP
jgi:predicted O-methyltransferase YrrM